MNSFHFGCRCRWLAHLCGPLLVLPLMAGCGGGKGKLSGQVLYNGKPVTGGWVTFRPADGRENPVMAQIDEKGNYEATLPAGEVKIAVNNRDLEPASPNAASPSR